MDGIHHPTFQTTCGALGFLEDDQEWDACLREACIDHDATRLRKLFVILLLFCAPLRPEVLWERYQDEMSHDTWYRRRGEGGTSDDAYNDSLLLLEGRCRIPTLAKCEDEIHTPKVGDLESSGTPKCLEFDRRGQNTSDWGVLGVIGKVLKCRCPKWPRIGHLDIYSPSYGQKKGRESNWQFDSRPQKVENQPLPNVCRGSVMGRWKPLEESYNFGLNLTPIGGRG